MQSDKNETIYAGMLPKYFWLKNLKYICVEKSCFEHEYVPSKILFIGKISQSENLIQ